MANRRRSATLPNAPSMPPGATRAAPSGANSYAARTLEELINAPTRQSQPHLHPDKLNGALWFGIDKSVYAFVRATWQGNFMGAWKSWKDVPKERRDAWWQTFVQNYYWEKEYDDLVYFLWKLETRTTISGRISKKKRHHQKPTYISEDQWTYLKEEWATEPALKRSKTAAACRTSNPDGKGMHKHCAGPVSFAKIEYDMMIEAGTNERPPFTALLRKTRTRKDGTFVERRAEDIVTEVELTASQQSPPSDGSPNATPTIALNQTFLQVVKPKRGYVYGLGSAQYRNFNPTQTASASLARNIDTDARISALATDFETINSNVTSLNEGLAEVKTGMAATQAALNVILQNMGINPVTLQPLVSNNT